MVAAAAGRSVSRWNIPRLVTGQSSGGSQITQVVVVAAGRLVSRWNIPKLVTGQPSGGSQIVQVAAAARQAIRLFPECNRSPE